MSEPTGLQPLLDFAEAMKSDPVRNYVIAGLDSYLLGGSSIRYFECSRDHQDSITPHSHRFDFACIVLSGHVRNRIWEPSSDSRGDCFQSSSLVYQGAIGEHNILPISAGYWRFTEVEYWPGDSYSMTSEQIHSIHFSRGAKVLFLEGPQRTNESLIIEPVVNGEVIRTYFKLHYMFQRDSLGDTPPTEDKNDGH